MNASPETRFWAKVDRRDDGECWPWLGLRKARGYGRFYIDGKEVPAHRFAYGLVVEEVPEELVVHHVCENTSCVNPSHLKPMTSAEHGLLGSSPLAVHARKTHCIHDHALDDENTYWRKNGQRACKTCARLRNAKPEYREKNTLRAQRRRRVLREREVEPAASRELNPASRSRSATANGDSPARAGDVSPPDSASPAQLFPTPNVPEWA